jgi:nucleotide-binding universal stress UspA family protein
MEPTKQPSKINHILCPTDLSNKSQKALGVAARLAERLRATLTAAHCAPANWFTSDNRIPRENLEEIRNRIKKQIAACQHKGSTLTWRSLVTENSFDPARDILGMARETAADLIIMKARPGVLSAFRFGSIVERIVEAAPCPVLLLPSRVLSKLDPTHDDLEFRKILFDCDFSDGSDDLFSVVNALTEGYHAELRMLSVLEPARMTTTEAAPIFASRTHVQTLVRGKLGDVLDERADRSQMEIHAEVEWGRHAGTVLQHAESHGIDLICTALTPPHFYFEKLYRTYLGSLLRSANCPILVKQSAGSKRVKEF